MKIFRPFYFLIAKQQLDKCLRQHGPLKQQATAIAPTEQNWFLEAAVIAKHTVCVPPDLLGCQDFFAMNMEGPKILWLA